MTCYLCGREAENAGAFGGDDYVPVEAFIPERGDITLCLSCAASNPHEVDAFGCEHCREAVRRITDGEGTKP